MDKTPHKRIEDLTPDDFAQDFVLHEDEDVTPDISNGKKKPLPHQLEAFHIMTSGSYSSMFRWLLGDEMGLGKTIEALLVCKWLLAEKPDATILIVCPNSLRINWIREWCSWVLDIDKATLADMSLSQMMEKSEIEMCVTQICIPANVIVASYEGLRKWGPVMGKSPISGEPWDLLIADEVHFCKDPSAQRSQALFAIDAERKLWMTGTPIPNYPYEIFPIIHNLRPDIWDSIQGFENRYCNAANNKYGRNLDELHARLRFGRWNEVVKQRFTKHHWRAYEEIFEHDPIMIRRLKKDVLKFLPKKRRQIIEIPAEGKLKELVDMEKMLTDGRGPKGLYEELLKEVNALRDGGESDEGFELVIEMLMQTKRYRFEEISRIRHMIALAKIPEVVEHIKTTLDEEDKVVVFIHHNDVAKRYMELLNDFNPVLVDGSVVNPLTRDERVHRFQNDPGTRVFIGGLMVAGMGITLTAASHVIFAELDWSPGTLTQCEDRCHRIGQEEKVLVQHLVVEDSMDAFMAKKIVNKQRSIKKALDAKTGMRKINGEVEKLGGEETAA